MGVSIGEGDGGGDVDVDLARVGSQIDELWVRPSGNSKRGLFWSDGGRSVRLDEGDGQTVHSQAVETRSGLREIGSRCDDAGPSEIYR
jgi:hypothetical protein